MQAHQFLFYGSVVDLQCVLISIAGKVTTAYILPLLFGDGLFQILNIVPCVYTRTLLFIHPKWHNLYPLTPNSQPILSLPYPSPSKHHSFSMSVSLSVRFICGVLFFFLSEVLKNLKANDMEVCQNWIKLDRVPPMEKPSCSHA